MMFTSLKETDGILEYKIVCGMCGVWVVCIGGCACVCGGWVGEQVSTVRMDINVGSVQCVGAHCAYGTYSTS